MGHIRDYSEEVAAAVDEEVKKLIENAHDEAWRILVDNRDILDTLVVALLEKETLDKTEVSEIFAPMVKFPPRPAWTGSSRRVPSERGPVMTPKEIATNGSPNGQTGNGLAGEAAPGEPARPDDVSRPFLEPPGEGRA
jgi:cell division protease FtsH